MVGIEVLALRILMSKEKLFSVKKQDCEFEYFRAGGKGGQKQNKTSSGVRCRHKPSGAVGEAREERSQLQNKRLAFQRMADTSEFRLWVRLQAAQINGVEAQIEEVVNDLMRPENLLIENFDPNE